MALWSSLAGEIDSLEKLCKEISSPLRLMAGPFECPKDSLCCSSRVATMLTA